MGKCLHFPMALLLLFYVAKATTEMKRSGIEVRVAPCGWSRYVHVAKATTEMERSGIEVRAARCGRSRYVHVAKATLHNNRLNNMHDHKYTYCCSECNMYPAPENLLCFFLQRCEKCKNQEQHPSELSGHHCGPAPREDAVCQPRGEQDDPVNCVKSCDVPDPRMFLCRFCCFSGASIQRISSSTDMSASIFSKFKIIPSGSNKLS